jgi:hypothetical protein
MFKQMYLSEPTLEISHIHYKDAEAEYVLL